MIINKIIKLGLEGRVNGLKENHSEREIASLLSTESNQKITQSCVHRYLALQERTHKDLIEKKENLQAKIIEAEIDTIAKRNKIVERLERIADKAEEQGISKTVIEALKIQIAALDSLDKRLGRFTESKNEQTVINIIVSNEVDV